MASKFVSFLANKYQLLSAIASSTGASDADKIVATDANGIIDRSFLSIQLSPVTTNGAVSYDFTGIPDWVTEIQIPFSNMSTNGNNIPLFQLGDSGGIETSGYLGGAARVTASTFTALNNSAGFLTNAFNSAAVIQQGIAFFTLIDPSTNTWAFSLNATRSDSTAHSFASGVKALSGTLDRIRLTTNSADTFDGGVMSLSGK